MGVSVNGGTPRSSILIGFSIINHPFLGYPYFWKHPYRNVRRGSFQLNFLFDKHPGLRGSASGHDGKRWFRARALENVGFKNDS